MKKYFLLILLLSACAPELSLNPSDDSEVYTADSSDSNIESGSNGVGNEGATSQSATIINPPDILILNEVYYDDPISDTDGHLFIELYGTAGASLNGYVIRMVNGANGEKNDDIALTETAVISENYLFVVADTKTNTDSDTYVENSDFISNFDPQNGPDTIQLLDPSGTLIDVVGYGEGGVMEDADGRAMYETSVAPLCDSGMSLARNSQSDTDNNSTDWVCSQAPSPGSIDVDTGATENTVSEVSQPEVAETTTQEIPVTTTSEPTQETDPVATYTSSEGSQSGGHLIFTEVVTDPQRDWNDTSGGDSIAFDSIPGTGTVGTTDEWIEIKNASDQTVDLRGWSLQMNDGTNETDIFSSPASTLVFSNQSSVIEFAPGDYLVVGNPPGDLKNTITLQLFDSENSLVDELDVPDANADSVSDESYQEINGTWQMGEATLGF